MNSFHRNKKEIAKLRETRLKWWVQDRFRVLPTDERFKALTEEQMFLMWENYLVDNPDIEKKMTEVYQDPEYATAEKHLDVDQRALDARREPELRSVEVEGLKAI